MKFSKELEENINEIFKNNDDIRERLLAGDAETIRKIGAISQKGMNPEDVVEAIESNDPEAIKYLYHKAQRIIGMQKLYKDLCDAYAHIKNEMER